MKPIEILNSLFLFICFSFAFSCGEDAGTTSNSNSTETAINIGTDTEAGVDTSNNKQPFKNLSDFGFFKGEIKNLDPKLQVIEYAPSSTLFTDYAEKERFVYFPKGEKATYNTDHEVFVFPVGTIIIKNFFYYNDARNPSAGRRIIETRLLVKRETQWDSYEYEWNTLQTDAVRKATGRSNIPDIVFIDKTGATKTITGYDLPSESKCVDCHSYKNAFSPIGPKPSLLNWDFDYGGTIGTANQIDKWVELGYLSTAGLPNKSNIQKIPNYYDETASIESRGKAYLDINCAHCHNANGTVKGNGFYVNYSNTDYGQRGIGKKPTTYQGSGLDYDMYAGDAEKSVLFYRMTHTGPADIMPAVGRNVNHTEGIEIVRQYINSLDPNLNPSVNP